MNYVPIRERMKKRENEKKRQRLLSFSDALVDIKRNPMIAMGLGGSALLTSLMGLFIGLNPKMDSAGNIILFGGVSGFGAVLMGIFFGVLYSIAFPVIGEWASYYWYRKAALRDEDNVKQAIVSYVMLSLAFAFMLTTAIAASYILASLLHTFRAFYAIPEWAQKWTVLIIPIALAIHAGANMYYDHVSEYAKERRELERGLETARLEAENRMREARVKAEEEVARAMAEEYARISGQQARVTGVTLAQKVWKDDKERFAGDHDKDGIPNAVDKDFVQQSGRNPHVPPR